jgi:multicomponent Na+:H+ antiporter subunit D
VYALLRTFTLIFVLDVAYTHTVLLVIAGLTMVVGALGALSQSNLRRIFSFLIISHIGFSAMGLAFLTPFALAGAIFYLIQDMLVLTALFLVGGLIRKNAGTEEIQELGGLYRTAPGLALLFLIPALSLAGIPPLSGFFAKVALLRAGLELGQYGIVATALVTSLLTLVVVARLWAEIFWKQAPEPKEAAGDGAHGPARSALVWSPVTLLAGLVVLLGLLVEPVFAIATLAGHQLADPAPYIRLVLGG